MYCITMHYYGQTEISAGSPAISLLSPPNIPSSLTVLFLLLLAPSSPRRLCPLRGKAGELSIYSSSYFVRALSTNLYI